MIESRTFTTQAHSKCAFEVMHELKKKQQLCDIVLCIEGAKFHAHKIVLSGTSPYLRAMFTNGMLESEKDVIEIHGIEACTMELLLEYMYTGTVEISVENVQSILQGASLLGLLSLRNICAHFLQSQLTASNCLGIHHFADVFSCTELEATARRFIYQNFLEIIHADEFLQLPEERLIELLKSDKLQVDNEQQVFEAACGWIQWDPMNRLDKGYRILQNIRLILLDLSYLEDVVLKLDFFKNCPKCQLLISKSISQHPDSTAVQLTSSIVQLTTPRAQPPSIYVVGGRNSTDCQLKSMERYDFLTDQWVLMPSLNIARTAVGTTTLDNMLYSVGGECALIDTQEDTLYLRCVECYDPVLKQWIPKPEMKIARSFIAVVAVGGILYAIGGEDRSCAYNIVEKFDPKTETWSFGPSMKRKRAGAGVTVCDGKIYVVGGYDKTLHMDRASVECYDPENKEWTFVAEMEKARSGLSLITVDHYIYAFGGRFRHTDQYFDLVERYNTVTRQWTTLRTMNTPRAWPGVTLFDGRMYVVGGFDGSSRLRTGEVYDPESDHWAFISNMIVSRAGCGASVV